MVKISIIIIKEVMHNMVDLVLLEIVMVIMLLVQAINSEVIKEKIKEKENEEAGIMVLAIMFSTITN